MNISGMRLHSSFGNQGEVMRTWAEALVVGKDRRGLEMSYRNHPEDFGTQWTCRSRDDTQVTGLGDRQNDSRVNCAGEGRRGELGRKVKPSLLAMVPARHLQNTDGAVSLDMFPPI